MNDLSVIPSDPSLLAYPATLPIEIALRERPVQEVCEAYDIDKARWDRLRFDPVFREDLRRCVEELRKDGMSFKIKARLQASELLKRSWQMIHAPHEIVPPAVAADLIKFTVRAAGLDGSKDQAAANAAVANALQININLG